MTAGTYPRTNPVKVVEKGKKCGNPKELWTKAGRNVEYCASDTRGDADCKAGYFTYEKAADKFKCTCCLGELPAFNNGGAGWSNVVDA